MHCCHWWTLDVARSFQKRRHWQMEKNYKWILCTHELILSS
jgi:hypothetical protein